MSHNDNTAAQMLLFPVQRTTEEELAACDDTHILYWQARLAITDWINSVTVHQEPIPAKLSQLIQDFNILAREVGYAPLGFQSS